MAQATQARQAALQVLAEQRRSQNAARELLRASDAVSSLSESDRGQATKLVLGVVATQGVLDSILDGHLRHPRRLQPRVRDALRLSSFELCYLGTRADVAVSQGVELARSINPHVAGLANAVLRRVAREDAARVVQADAHLREDACTVVDLSLASGLPEWLLERVVDDRGLEAARSLARCSLEAAPIWVAANRALHDPQQVERLLSDQGLEPKADVLPASFRLGNPGSLARTGLVRDVDVIVADLGAQAVARLVNPSPTDRVLEVGQGRGTKTLLMENRSLEQGAPCHISAAEADAPRSEIAEIRMRRVGLQEWVAPRVLDARRLSASDERLPHALRGSFDVVFIDAPCTGTGTLRRHPEIAWRLKQEDVASLAGLQGELLSAAASKVAPGGRLVYATCSVLKEEDEGVVARFLASEAGQQFAVQDAETLLLSGIQDKDEQNAVQQRFADALQHDGSLRTHPCSDGFDGHFCVSLVRKA